jgi:hypothetical protein
MTETDPHYHKQPHTQDPTKDIPEDPPLAQGHDAEEAADVKDAQEQLKAQVEDEREAREQAAERGEPEPGAPGDPTNPPGENADPGVDPGSQVPGQTPAEADETSDESDCPPSGTVDEVLGWVGDDPDRAQKALNAERDGQNRSSLIAKLEAI